MHFRSNQPTLRPRVSPLSSWASLGKLLNLSEQYFLSGTAGIEPVPVLCLSTPQKVTAQHLTHSWCSVNVYFLPLSIK